METSSRMEDELKCPACRRLYVNPVQLPGCWHHLCYCCAAARMQPVASGNTVSSLSSSSPLSPASSASSTSSLVGGLAYSRLASSVSCQRVDDGCLKSSSSTSGTESTCGDQDSDGLSVASETDSGVVVVANGSSGGGSSIATGGSRPGSYVGTPIPASTSSTSFAKSTSSLSLQSDSSTGSSGHHSTSSSTASSSYAFVIVCPTCSRVAAVDGNLACLARPRALETIVDRYREARSLSVDCQLCVAVATASGPPSPCQQQQQQQPALNPASRVCEPCELYYCDSCSHAEGGPYSPDRHRVIGDLAEGRRAVQSRHRDVDGRCVDHRDEQRSLYCLVCRATVCCACVQQGRHAGHQAQPMGAMCRAQKSELSQLIHGLSEKARSGTEFIARLKCMQDRIETNCAEFETRIAAECDALVSAVRWRQQQLVAHVRRERALKQQTYRDQVTQCTAKVHKTTGLLQFSVEVMKETDPTAFLQISSPLIKRVAQVDSGFVKEVEFEPRVAPEFEMQLDRDPVLAAIQSMNFLEMKVPAAPRILVRESSVLNNTITFVWEATSSANSGTNVNGYVLELDDGSGGEFREVFTGKETICTVEGLHFDTSYVARVKAFNNAGHSAYSPSVCLRTAKVAWFNFDPASTSRDVMFSNDNRTVTTSSFDDRVVLGTVGVTRGVHYWEVVVDRYENNKDPAFGIARLDVAKDKLLGADSKGWSMYIDAKRSWFMHSGVHTARTDGGIVAGSVVGILLDLDRRMLSFYLDGEHHGPIAFTEPSAGLGQGGAFFPAVSVNRNVQLTLHSGLVPPVDSDSDDG